jgi:hypothetical protein
MKMSKTGWIGVDFDGTLATDVDSLPIKAMVDRVKRWLSLGIEVRIVTARVNEPDIYKRITEEQYLEDWCLQHIGTVLAITCCKDYNMYQLWDDRAVQVIKDIGERVGNVNRYSEKYTGKTIIDEETGYSV